MDQGTEDSESAIKEELDKQEDVIEKFEKLVEKLPITQKIITEKSKELWAVLDLQDRSAKENLDLLDKALEEMENGEGIDREIKGEQWEGARKAIQEAHQEEVSSFMQIVSTNYTNYVDNVATEIQSFSEQMLDLFGEDEVLLQELEQKHQEAQDKQSAYLEQLKEEKALAEEQAAQEAEQKHLKEYEDQQALYTLELQALESHLQQTSNMEEAAALSQQIRAARQKKIQAEQEERQRQEEKKRQKEKQEEEKKIALEQLQLEYHVKKAKHNYDEATQAEQSKRIYNKTIVERTFTSAKLAFDLALAIAAVSMGDLSKIPALVTIPLQTATLWAVPLPEKHSPQEFSEAFPTKLAQGGIFPASTQGHLLQHSLPSPQYLVAEAGSPEAVLPLNKATFARLGIGGEQKTYNMHVNFQVEIHQEVDQDQFLENLRYHLTDLWRMLQEENAMRDTTQWA